MATFDAAAASSSALWEQLNAATALSLKFAPAGFFRRNGNSAQVPEEISMLRDAATGQLSTGSKRRPRVICEVGFNAGHSAIVSVHALSL
jgi:hypothetical protein